MLAIPVFCDRVAPVFDWCSKLLILHENGERAASGCSIAWRGDGFNLMRRLRDQGVKTIICGALSNEILAYGQSLGLRIIFGVAGGIDEVLVAYHAGDLDQPKYRLPGCRGLCRYRGGNACKGQGNARKPGKTESPGASRPNTAAGTSAPGGQCVCPGCGAKMLHERGIPCSELQCPACGISMVRE